MKKILSALAAIVLFLLSDLSFGQAPNLATLNCYALFSANGAVTNTGISIITGDVGTNSGTASGFTTSSVAGSVHAVPDGSTATSATDLNSAYTYLNSLSHDIELPFPATFGHNLVLTPHIYLLNSPTILTDTLYLDGEGNTAAIFVILVNGALSASINSQMILTNGAQAKNVYWKVEGNVDIHEGSVFSGTIVANNNDININSGVVLNGRALTTSGTITATATSVIASVMPFSGNITGSGRMFIGGSTTLSITGIAGGSWIASNASATVISGVVTGIMAGTDTIMYIVTNACGADTATKIVTVNGASNVCVGSMVTLTDDVSGGTWTRTNATASVSAGIVTGIAAGRDTIRYIAGNSCGTDTASIIITINPLPDAGSISGVSTVLAGTAVTLAATAAGGTWVSSSTSIATVSSTGVVTGIAPGIDTINYSVVNSCGSAVTRKIITVYVMPYAGIITGASSVCIGSVITLTDTAVGGTWASSNSKAAITATGVVTGLMAGVDTIIYTVANAYGTSVATKIITINASPLLTSSVTPTSVCDSAVFSYVPLSDSTPAVFSWVRPPVAGISNSTASGSGAISEALVNITANTIAATYIYTITANGCSSSSNVTVIVNPTPRLAGVLLDTICSGTLFNYTAASLTPGTTLTWYRALVAGILPGSSSGTTNISEVLTNSLLTPIEVHYVFILSANGCTFQQSVSVTVNPRPAAPVITTKSPSPLCAGTMYQNFGTDVPPSVGTEYHWSATNAEIWATGHNGQNAVVNFPNSGTAQILLSATNTGFPCQSADAYTVNVGNTMNIVPSIFYFQYHFVCLPSNLDAYQWGYDDVVTLDSTTFPGEINQDYIDANPDYANKYYWVNTSYNGCTQKTYYNAPLALQNVNAESITNINLYPNPANELLNVIINTAIKSDMQIEVLNMTGQKLSSVLTTNNKATFDLVNFPAGLYLVVCYSGGVKIASARFVKN